MDKKPLSETDRAKLKLLREVVEVLMWELNSIRQSQWEELPKFAERKQQFLNRMEEYDWAPAPQDRDNLELMVLKSQITDLEYQIRKMLEGNMNVIQSQLNDLRQRHNRWRNSVASYLKK